MPTYRISESETRYSLIDPQLSKAGWKISDRSQVGIEIPVEGYDAAPSGGFTDYCLYRSNSEVLAVVEAKRTSRDPRVGKQQVLDYITAIERNQSFRPFAFMANGEDVFFWESDAAAQRHVAGFFSRENLERLLFLKQNGKPLNSVQIKSSIVDRSYQTEAIRRISEAIEKKRKRKALLVMATGTGKTRTIMALIDVFLRAHAAQKVLFLADRDALVEQAQTDGFKAHLPNESRSRIRTYSIDRTARVYVSTLQTLELCYDKFTPADFDLIISDECHRSIYNKFTDVLAYFDAIQIGLTATPAEYVDRDTFNFFDCDDRIPTFNYPFSQAVEEEYLVNFDVYAAQTKFQRKGIKGIDLTEEEKESLRKRGIDPEEIDYEGTDLERKVTNKETLKRQWEEFMDVCIKDSTGQLPGKSIIFAITHNHALRLAEAFDEMYPEHQGKLVQVITSKMERAPTLLDTFKKQDLPRIAISVDMLDTGVDIPEVVNLAFMKPVNSRIKFWQMIGRGSRSDETCKHFDWLPNRKKERFLITDFWENFEHFNMMPKEEEGAAQLPVLVSIFNARLLKLQLLLAQQPQPQSHGECSRTVQGASELVDDISRTIRDIRGLIRRIPLQSFSVKKAFKEVRDAWEDDFWNYITSDKIGFLKLKVAPLLRFVPHVRPAEEFFVNKMERCVLALLQGKELKPHIDSIREDVSLLPTNLQQVAERQVLINEMLGSDFWGGLTLKRLDDARDAVAPLMKYRRERPSLLFELGLDDIIDSRKWVLVRKGSEGGMSIAERKRACVSCGEENLIGALYETCRKILGAGTEREARERYNALCENERFTARQHRKAVRLLTRRWDHLMIHHRVPGLLRTINPVSITSALGLFLGRGFLGLASDLASDKTMFVSNTASKSVEKLLTHRRKLWEHSISAGTPIDVDRLRHSFQSAFRDFKAKY
ncbi:MAG: DEAD/DEAH box helicase [Ignavibacteria bacterium]|nr:DEAD/DEAH box helicase [Ignavibacteria bacterium]